MNPLKSSRCRIETALLILFWICGAMGSAALAATINVPANQPTIQKAIDAAVNGDTVIVAPGTYVENINFKGKSITLKSSDGAKKTVIDGNQEDSVLLFRNGERTTVDGFTLTRGYGIGTFGGAGGISISGNSAPILMNLIITNNVSHDGGGIGCNTASPTLINVEITKNTSHVGAGIYIDNCQYTLENVTVADNHSEYSMGGGLFSHNSGVLNATNSIFWNNTPNNINTWGTPAINFTYSDIQGGWSGDGNINVDPQFIGNGDYHLSDNSPALGKGTSSGAPTNDLEGNPRPYPVGSNPDMGAYELSGVPANACNLVNDGLLACYPFDGNANDESGHGYNGTVNGATLTTDRFGNAGKAYSFNGSTSVTVSTPWKEPYTNEITQSFWFNPSIDFNNSTPRQDILVAQMVQSYYIGSSQGGWDNKSGLVVEIWGDFFPPKFYGVPMNFAKDTWHHVVIQAKEFEFARIIIDGKTYEQDAPNFTFSDPSVNPQSLSVHIGVEWNQLYFNGKIDDVLIYDRAITEAEVKQLYDGSGNTTCTEWNLQKDFLASPNQKNPNPDSCGNQDVWQFMRGASTTQHQPSAYPYNDV